MTSKWKKLLISPETSIRDAMEVIDREALRVALVVTDGDKLAGIVTDGDIRRGILSGVDLSDKVEKVMNSSPIVASERKTSAELKEIMRAHSSLSIPIVDGSGSLVGLKTLHEALEVEKKDNPIFIMAGGFGTRLRPLTDNCPKPMLKVGDKPMLETLIRHFKSFGFNNFYISTHYLPEVITEYFGNGEAFGVNITYVHEEEPLGTAGALSLLPDSLPNKPLIMINGDILTNVNFTKVLEFHESQDSDATMCVRDYEIKVPFGVIEGEGHVISDIVEKPTYRYFVNAGIYVISPEIIRSLGKSEYLDMPSLFQRKKDEDCRVLKFPIHEYWLDIGRHDDFKRAQIDIHDLGLF
ncbi:MULTISPECIES: nucleotidyltransferase family protein [Pseudoalteromonas]|uniref:CBS domain-containing protein n=1 Tax=Pseudoalteromonas rubra TaxID=43658 RepID=A0A5S3V541_9GAMM|nr:MULTISPECIES: nucleotidyltransferase family protein [Pseudoalteromonas]MCG7562510.1 nucleotidyltransferase family protein [Pseudoalteromonas sp. McH1-42]MEC4089932.1 nucleotidyltransferase family protein [Pseudoalteromonas rubra]QPB84636.1 CBS domain-containing protein [Pseudoalteromonas rubra]